MGRRWPATTREWLRSTSFATTAQRVFLYAFDLIELNGDDLRRDPLEVRKATLRSMLAKAGLGLRFNEHLEGDLLDDRLRLLVPVLRAAAVAQADWDLGAAVNVNLCRSIAETRAAACA